VWDDGIERGAENDVSKANNLGFAGYRWQTFSHDLIAQKNPTIASSAVTKVTRSTVAAFPAPDSWNMYRSKLGVIAL
jgi:hypothetical protein